MQVKNFPKEFTAFSDFTVEDFASKGYLERVNLLKERFVGKKRVYRVRLRRGNQFERMLLSIVGAEELLANYAGIAKKWKSAAMP
jgi:hypothetical protein